MSIRTRSKVAPGVSFRGSAAIIGLVFIVCGMGLSGPLIAKSPCPDPGCCCTTPGPELVINGTFDAGDSDFTSDADFSDSAGWDIYTITDDAGRFLPSIFTGIGNGLFLLLDSPADGTSDNAVAWQPEEPIHVTQNNQYCFSARFMNVNKAGQTTATIQIRINGIALETQSLH